MTTAPILCPTHRWDTAGLRCARCGELPAREFTVLGIRIIIPRSFVPDRRIILPGR